MRKVIEIENLSKVYDLGLVGTGTLSKDLNRMWAKLRGKQDPYATLVELNDRTQKSSSNMVYALKDINFSVKQGEVLGIIGKNGAGKSTLLKILSQITSPTTGTIKMKGRVASLLEVGTGMHPEMTARQNIYLNGSLMGMRRHEITAKLDEIVDFAGIEKYVDTPTKRFSSGMTVRLGFAIAAFLDPEVLIVDEVLAVGDTEFQKKAIGKMQDISSGQGRTVLVVSHNMNSIRNLCRRCVLLENGKISKAGEVNEVVDYYLSQYGVVNQRTWDTNMPGDEIIQLKSAKLINQKFELIQSVAREEMFGVELQYNTSRDGFNVIPNIHVHSNTGERIFITADSSQEASTLTSGRYRSVVWIPSHFLNENKYSLLIALTSTTKGTKAHVKEMDCLVFEVSENRKSNEGGFKRKLPGYIKPDFDWEFKKL